MNGGETNSSCFIEITCLVGQAGGNLLSLAPGRTNDGEPPLEMYFTLASKINLFFGPVSPRLGVFSQGYTGQNV